MIEFMFCEFARMLQRQLRGTLPWSAQIRSGQFGVAIPLSVVLHPCHKVSCHSTWLRCSIPCQHIPSIGYADRLKSNLTWLRVLGAPLAFCRSPALNLYLDHGELGRCKLKVFSCRAYLVFRNRCLQERYGGGPAALFLAQA